MANDPLEELVAAAREVYKENGLSTKAQVNLSKVILYTDWAAYRLVKKEELERLVEAAARAYDKREGLWPDKGELYEALQPFKDEEDE